MTTKSSSAGTLLKGPYISQNLFGGVLDYDGAGHYPGLELMNLVFGTVDSEGEHVLLPDSEKIQFRRRAHDFARMLVWDDEKFAEDPRRKEVFLDDQSEEAMRKMMECLQLEIPNGNSKSIKWERAHFFPYTRSLIHWDARRPKAKNGNVLIERRYLRGGGALAFRVLRMDPDKLRLEKCRVGFRELFEGNDDSSLETLAGALAVKGRQDESPIRDDIEAKSEARDDGVEDLYRQGVCSILAHTELASVVRIRALMRWTAFWLVLMQHTRAANSVGTSRSYLVCDCGSSYAQLRRASQRCLKEVQSRLIDAVEARAVELGGHVSKSTKDKIRGFFWASSATIGLLNAWKGRRHFTLGIGMVETLVMATTKPYSEISFEEFVGDKLFDDYSLVIGRHAAERAGLLTSIDASVFEDNESQLARQMLASGLLTAYSDATRMVGTGGPR